MRAREFIIETPRVAAHRPEILSATDDGKTITIKVRTHDGSVRAISNSNPAVLQQQLNLKYGLRLPHSIARKFVGMPAEMAEDQADNPDSWESQAADAERDEETVRMADRDAEAGGLAEQEIDEDLSRRGFLQGLAAAVAGAATGNAFAGSSDPGFIRQVQDQHYSMIEKNPRYAKEHQALQLPFARGIAGSSAETNKRWAEKTAELLQKYGVKVNEGVAEGSLNEKSTSQAQFRTMAAASHNPKFAKKVGISPDVAREFHGADKKSNYKSLPRKAAEDASWGMAPEGRGYKK